MKNKDETAARIERNAIDYVFTETGYQVLPEHYNWKEAYIAGATAERTRADQESAAYREEIERLKNDLADSLEENRKLKEILKELLTKIAMSFDVDYDKG